ncbi:TPA: hypothetical protein HNN99_25935, partial [Escherichia coli]|nr:hypothetical protein [Escherichia coli]
AVQIIASPFRAFGAGSSQPKIRSNHLKFPQKTISGHKITHRSSERGHIVSVIHINPQIKNFKKPQT